MFTDKQAKLKALTQTMNQPQERVGRIETCLKNCNGRKEEPDPNHNEHEEESGSLIPYQRWNEQDPDDKYLKSIKLDILTFDGHLDLQLFLEWLQYKDKYFTWYPLFEARKVKFIAMELTCQASQYWTNVESMRVSRHQDPIETWSAMKDKLRAKYVDSLWFL